MTTAILISACALLFTVGSLWWLNARSGRLLMTEIVTFSAYAHARRAMLRIPVALYNTGAKPLVIVDLRLELSSAGLSFVAPSQTFRSSMEPKAGDVDDFPHPYVCLLYTSARLLSWRSRGSFLVLWTDLAAWSPTTVELRAGATRYSPELRR